jgi:hypothetical protein
MTWLGNLIALIIGWAVMLAGGFCLAGLLIEYLASLAMRRMRAAGLFMKWYDQYRREKGNKS